MDDRKTLTSCVCTHRRLGGLAVGVFMMLSAILAYSFPVSHPATASAMIEDPQSVQAADPPATAPEAKPALPPDPAAALAERWGIRVESLRLSANGYMLDFRFRVLDPAKAAPLFDKTVKTFLLDQASGAQMFVPSSPKVGALRSSGKTILPNRVYFVIFANPACYIKAGNKVTVVIGDFRAEDIPVGDLGGPGVTY